MEYTERPRTTVSGREKYTSSKMHCASWRGSIPCSERMPPSDMRTISPGRTSRTNVAPTMSRAHVSLATTQPSVPSAPMTSGRMPLGSRNAYSAFSRSSTMA